MAATSITSVIATIATSVTLSSLHSSHFDSSKNIGQPDEGLLSVSLGTICQRVGMFDVECAQGRLIVVGHVVVVVGTVLLPVDTNK